MGMVINTNVGAINANRNLSFNSTEMSKSMEKLSSGYRINRAADDAAGLAISEKMRFQINGYSQAIRNAQDGISLLQTGEGALTEVHAMLQRMNTLANQAANGTYDNADRLKSQQEVTQLLNQIDSIAKNLNFNGVTLLAANKNITFQVGVSKAEVINASLAIMTTGANGLKISTLSISTQTKAQSALATINSAIAAVSTQRATFGAVQNRLEHVINNLGVTVENLSASESRIRDTDMAQEMTNFTKNQILVQASTAMLAQANSLPQSVLKLLG
jgi:flagellin